MSARTVIVHGGADSVLEAALRAVGLVALSEADGTTVWGTRPDPATTAKVEPARPERRLLTIAEAGRILGVGRSMMYQLIARGDIESVHVGRCARVPVDAVDRLVDRLCDGYVTRTS